MDCLWPFTPTGTPSFAAPNEPRSSKSWPENVRALLVLYQRVRLWNQRIRWFRVGETVRGGGELQVIALDVDDIELTL